MDHQNHVASLQTCFNTAAPHTSWMIGCFWSLQTRSNFGSHLGCDLTSTTVNYEIMNLKRDFQNFLNKICIKKNTGYTFVKCAPGPEMRDCVHDCAIAQNTEPYFYRYGSIESIGLQYFLFWYLSCAIPLVPKEDA